MTVLPVLVCGRIEDEGRKSTACCRSFRCPRASCRHVGDRPCRAVNAELLAGSILGLHDGALAEGVSSEYRAAQTEAVHDHPHDCRAGVHIGIVGGGQLGRMMAMAPQLGYRCHIFARTSTLRGRRRRRTYTRGI